jgi:hypothetical protein
MLIEENKKIAINFLPLREQNFKWDVFCKKVDTPDQPNPSANIRRYKLPLNITELSGEYIDYYVSANAQPGFTTQTIKSNTNNELTVNMMFVKAIEKCKTLFTEDKYTIKTGYRNNIRFKMASFKEGHEEIWLEPYHLSATNQFGYLLGFHFRLAENQQLNKIVLQRSLSLGADGMENKNYYADNYKKINSFITNFIPQLFPPNLQNGLAVETNLRELAFKRLQPKRYIFKKNKTDASQFQGVKKYGPLKDINTNSLICFIYRPENKAISYDLFYALKGDKYGTFPGMKDMFSFSLGKEHVTGISIPDYSEQSISAAIEQIKTIANARPILPLLIVPWSRLEHEEEGDKNYFRIKHQFLSAGMPTQFVSLQRIRGRDGLKWSISNIGLAVFSKLGGLPWRLQPTHDKCLIIGIGQAHRLSDQGGVSRYYAYSVLADSSGLYDSIKVLSRAEKENEYLHGLTEKIKQVILEKAAKYDRFVIHTSFKLRKNELAAITKGLEDIFNDTKKEIVVLKFNDNSRYFGFSLTSNSKVPFESSCVSLRKNQYLVWFEGLQYHTPTLRRRIAKPMHIEFNYSSKELSDEDKISFLQDAINISGANWRGFNAKTSPISVYYAKIIADYIGHFDEYGLKEIDIENLVPWFL